MYLHSLLLVNASCIYPRNGLVAADEVSDLYPPSYYFGGQSHCSRHLTGIAAAATTLYQLVQENKFVPILESVHGLKEGGRGGMGRRDGREGRGEGGWHNNSDMRFMITFKLVFTCLQHFSIY